MYHVEVMVCVRSPTWNDAIYVWGYPKFILSNVCGCTWILIGNKMISHMVPNVLRIHFAFCQVADYWDCPDTALNNYLHKEHISLNNYQRTFLEMISEKRKTNKHTLLDWLADYSWQTLQRSSTHGGLWERQQSLGFVQNTARVWVTNSPHRVWWLCKIVCEPIRFCSLGVTCTFGKSSVFCVKLCSSF